MWFDSWSSAGRTVLVAVLGYGALVTLLRVTGKRTLSKMNAFDLIVTVALGSTLATLILDDSVPVANGVLSLSLLILLQYGVAWACARSTAVERVVKATPTLVFHRGEFLDDTLTRERLTRGEVLAAIRACGIARVDDVEAVILETAGELSVLPHGSEGCALANVERPAMPAARGDTPEVASPR